MPPRAAAGSPTAFGTRRSPQAGLICWTARVPSESQRTNSFEEREFVLARDDVDVVVGELGAHTVGTEPQLKSQDSYHVVVRGVVRDDEGGPVIYWSWMLRSMQLVRSAMLVQHWYPRCSRDCKPYPPGLARGVTCNTEAAYIVHRVDTGPTATRPWRLRGTQPGTCSWVACDDVSVPRANHVAASPHSMSDGTRRDTGFRWDGANGGTKAMPAMSTHPADP